DAVEALLQDLVGFAVLVGVVAAANGIRMVQERLAARGVHDLEHLVDGRVRRDVLERRQRLKERVEGVVDVLDEPGAQQRARAVSSADGWKSSPSSLALRQARWMPATESWSDSASFLTPSRAARSTTASGVIVPSEK